MAGLQSNHALLRLKSKEDRAAIVQKLGTDVNSSGHMTLFHQHQPPCLYELSRVETVQVHASPKS